MLLIAFLQLSCMARSMLLKLTVTQGPGQVLAKAIPLK